MKPLLVAKGIGKKFLKPTQSLLFEQIDLSIYPEESVAIVGKSGEGKTTLLHILGTLEDPSEGSLHISGKLVTSFNKTELRNRSIGFVFQGFHLLEDYTLLENVLMPAKIARKATHKGSASYQRAHELIEKVGLSKRISYPTKLLSGGEKQRGALARALCNDPDLILADEPSGNLDMANSRLIHQLLLDLARQEKKAVLIVTHDQELASLCSRTLLLKERQLTEKASIH